MKSEVNSALKAARLEIESSLKKFVTKESEKISNIGDELAPATTALSHFILDSGKRLRPLFSYVGYLGSAKEIRPEIISACASLELVHVCALIHDDLMDGSDTRRGAPAIHRLFEDLHRKNSYNGNPTQYGAAAAILLGDLALVWADKALNSSGITNEELVDALAVFNELRIELMAGQFLDVHEQTSHTSSIERSLKIARYKSGKYTIERPLHFGAALAGRNDLATAYSNYGLPLGEAFQLRDDVLGVFGESSVTGKPAGDDLLEGKRTALVAKVFELGNASQALTLTSVLGNRKANEEQINKAKAVIQESGALTFIENLITELTEKAVVAVKGLPNEDLLVELASITTKRSS